MYVIKDENIIPKFCMRKYDDSKGVIRYHRCYNPEWVYMQFLNEDCELVNEFVTNGTPLQYYYIGNDERCEDKEKIYTTTFKMWNNRGVRKHFQDYGKTNDFFNKTKEARKNKRSE